MIKFLQKRGWILLTVLTLALTLPFFQERIESTSQGIKVDTWSQDDNGLPKVEHVSGWVMYNPFRYKLIEYPGEFKELSGKYSFFTEEKLPVAVEISVFLRPASKQAGQIYQKYRLQPDELNQVLGDRLLTDAVKKAGERTPTDKLGSFTMLQTEITTELSKSIPEENMDFDNVVVRHIQLPGEIENAVRNKIKAREDIANQKQQTELEKEKNARNLIIAEGKAKVAEANALAASFKIREEAKNLTPLQIKKMWIEKWNGELPKTITAEQTAMLFNNLN